MNIDVQFRFMRDERYNYMMQKTSILGMTKDMGDV